MSRRSYGRESPLNAVLAFLEFPLTFFFCILISFLAGWFLLGGSCKYNFTPTANGSCVCGKHDHYCLCTPSLAVDGLIVSPERKILIVDRGAPPFGYAVVGGFVNVGETTEQAVRREMNEEVNLSSDDIDRLELLGIFDAPNRDKRRHTSSVAYVVHVTKTHDIRAGDDAKDFKWISLDNALDLNWAFDHREIVKTYLDRDRND